MDGMVKLGQLVRETREQRGETSQQLADAVGVSKATISNIERGVLRTPPDPSLLNGISKSLGVSVLSMLDAVGYDVSLPPDDRSEAVRRVSLILEGKELTDHQVRQIADMVRGMLELIEG